jgi:hypothetical protein
MLDADKLRDRPVIPANPRKSGLYATFSGLALHAPSVTAEGARVVRTVCLFGSRFVPKP